MKTSYTTPEKEIKLRLPALRISWLHIVAVALALLWFRSCGELSRNRQEIANYQEVLNDSISWYKNKAGQEVATRRALQGSNQALELMLSSSRDSTQQLKKLVDKYKKVSAAVSTTTKTVIDSIKIPYRVEGSSFSIPFQVSDPFYSLSGRSTESGLFLDNISIPNLQSFVIGARKKGLFKTEYRIEVVNSNPYIKTLQAEAYSFSPPPKRFGIGPLVGWGVSKEGFSGFLGVGLSYDLIRF